MKILRRILLAVALLFAALISTAYAQNALKPKGLIVYKNPLTDYVEVLEFSQFVDNKNQHPAPPYSTLRDLHGANVAVKNVGIVGVVYYPEKPYGPELPQMDKTESALIQSLIAKYPQHRARLEAAQALWDKALAESKKTQATTSPSAK